MLALLPLVKSVELRSTNLTAHQHYYHRHFNIISNISAAHPAGYTTLTDTSRCDIYSAQYVSLSNLEGSYPDPSYATLGTISAASGSAFDTWVNSTTRDAAGFFYSAFNSQGCSVSPSTATVRYLTTWICAWATVQETEESDACSTNSAGLPAALCDSLCTTISDSYVAMLSDSTLCPSVDADHLTTVKNWFTLICSAYSEIVAGSGQPACTSSGVAWDAGSCGYGLDKIDDAYSYCESSDGASDSCCESLSARASTDTTSASGASAAAAAGSASSGASGTSTASDSAAAAAATAGSGGTNSSSNSAGDSGGSSSSSSSSSNASASASTGLSTTATAAVAVATVLAVALLAVAAVLFLRRRRASAAASQKLSDVYYLPGRAPSPRPPFPQQPPQHFHQPRSHFDIASPAAAATAAAATGYYGPGGVASIQSAPTVYSATPSPPSPSANIAGARNPSITKVVHIRTGSPAAAGAAAGFSANIPAQASRYPPQAHDGAATATAGFPRRVNSVAKDGLLFDGPAAAAAGLGPDTRRMSVDKHSLSSLTQAAFTDPPETAGFSSLSSSSSAAAAASASANRSSIAKPPLWAPAQAPVPAAATPPQDDLPAYSDHQY
ncbi:hypothetical protein HK405_009300 [Cladochytrium tenue]|nr:hypothetical protein HK405_009300 [Cladochytrium tenue]